MHKVLLVDDMRRFLDLTRSFLSRADCRLLTANTGLEAIKVARSERPSLIVLDIEMPEMNGIEACRIIKSDPLLKQTPVVMLTSLSKEAEARRAGADHFLQKPIDETTFLREVKRFLPIAERSERRVAVNVAGHIEVADTQIPITVADLSATGAFITGYNGEVTIGDQFDLSFNLATKEGSRRVAVRAIVVRLAAAKAFGVRFHETTSGARMNIDEFLAAKA